jgi:hypothetical protein
MSTSGLCHEPVEYASMSRWLVVDSLGQVLVLCSDGKHILARFRGLAEHRCNDRGGCARSYRPELISPCTAALTRRKRVIGCRRFLVDFRLNPDRPPGVEPFIGGVKAELAKSSRRTSSCTIPSPGQDGSVGGMASGEGQAQDSLTMQLAAPNSAISQQSV